MSQDECSPTEYQNVASTVLLHVHSLCQYAILILAFRAGKLLEVNNILYSPVLRNIDNDGKYHNVLLHVPTQAILTLPDISPGVLATLATHCYVLISFH